MEEVTCNHATELANLENRLAYLSRVITVLEQHNVRLEGERDKAEERFNEVRRMVNSK